MKLGKLRWKNFMSYGAAWTELDLGSNKMVNILGTNGDGKSIFIDVLHYVLTGKPFRKVKMSEIPNTINKKNCVVELTAERGEKSVTIRRGMQPSVFDVEVNGLPLDKDSVGSDLQSRLESILGFNSKTLRYVLIMSSMNYKPLLKMDAAEKRLFVDDVLNIGVFTELGVFVKQKLSVLKTKITDAEYLVKSLESSLALIREMNAKVVHNSGEQVAMIREKVNELRHSVLSLEQANKSTAEFLAAAKKEMAEIESARDELLKAVKSQSDALIAAERDKIETETRDRIETGARAVDSMKADHAAAIGKLEEKSRTIAEKLTRMRESLSKLDANGQAIVKEMATATATVDSEMAALNKKRGFLTDNSQCPQCERTIDDKFRDSSFAVLDEEAAALEARRDAINARTSEVEEINDQMFDMKRSIAEYQCKGDEFNSKLSDFRLSCQRAVSELKAETSSAVSELHEMLNTRISEISNSASERMTEIRAEFSDRLTEVKNRCATLSTEGKARTQSIADKKDTIRDYVAQIERLENPEVKEVKDETAVLDDLNNARKTLDALNERKRLHEVAIKLLSDKGFKTFIIKKYIPVLNKYVNDYLELLEAKYRLKVDENLDVTIVARGYEQLSYESFSSGEKARCDLAMVFGFLELSKRKASVETNFLALDEVAENSLDKSGVYGILNIINRLKTRGYTVFVISHRDEIRDQFDMTLQATKGVFSELAEATS